MLLTHSQLWLGEEELVPGLGGGDINHRKHLSGWQLELKENTWPKGRTSHPGLWGLGDCHCRAGRLGHVRFRPGNPEKGPCHCVGSGGCACKGDWDNSSSGGSPCWGTHPVGVHNGPALLCSGGQGNPKPLSGMMVVWDSYLCSLGYRAMPGLLLLMEPSSLSCTCLHSGS